VVRQIEVELESSYGGTVWLNAMGSSGYGGTPNTGKYLTHEVNAYILDQLFIEMDACDGFLPKVVRITVAGDGPNPFGQSNC
jgi:hypothetical protein